MGFYKPKKDRCTECKKFELMSAANQEAYKSEIGQHLERHREAQTAKTNDTQRSNDEKNIQISDQSPLTCNQVFRYHHQMLLWCTTKRNFVVTTSLSMNRVSLIMLIAIYGRRLMDVVAATKLDHAYYNTCKVSHNQSKKYPCFPILVVVKTQPKYHGYTILCSSLNWPSDYDRAEIPRKGSLIYGVWFDALRDRLRTKKNTSVFSVSVWRKCILTPNIIFLNLNLRKRTPLMSSFSTTIVISRVNYNNKFRFKFRIINFIFLHFN